MLAFCKYYIEFRNLSILYDYLIISLYIVIYKYDYLCNLVSLYSTDTFVNCVHNFLGNNYTTTSFML